MDATYNTGALDLHEGDQVPLQVDSAGRLKTVSTSGASADQVQGNAAGATTTAGNPVVVGGRYNTTPPTYTNGQRTDAQTDARGNVLVGIANGEIQAIVTTTSDAGPAVPGLFVWNFNQVNDGATWNLQRGDTNGTVVRSALGSASWTYAGATGGILNTSDVAIAAARGAGVRNFLHSLWFKNTAAVASEIVIKDGSTVIWRGHVSASMTFGEAVQFDPPLRGTANTALNIALLTTATATIVSAQGSTGA